MEATLTKCSVTSAELEQMINILYDYYYTNDRKVLDNNRDLLLKIKNADYGSTTQTEYSTGQSFNETTHGPGRMIIFLLNYYGEKYLENGTLTIYEDDPKVFSNSHTNTYKLILKDPETHDTFGGYTPTADDKPYDFNSLFQSQITVYKENGKQDNTTTTAWESFHGSNLIERQKGYYTPRRTFDFKSAYWKQKHEHGVDYLLQLGFNLELSLKNRLSNQYKNFEFIPTAENKVYLQKYASTLVAMDHFGEYAWSNFIID